jgi:hypothetical protein
MKRFISVLFLKIKQMIEMRKGYFKFIYKPMNIITTKANSHIDEKQKEPNIPYTCFFGGCL